MHPSVYEWFKTFIPANVGVPFYETQGVMLQQKDLPPMWATVEWDRSSLQRITVGRPWISREYGTCTVVFVGKAGTGPAALLLAGQAFVNTVEGGELIAGVLLAEPNAGPVGTLRVENISPPDPEPYEDGNWLMCTVSCVYTYDSVRGAVVTP